jgi:hypothetical protein
MYERVIPPEPRREGHASEVTITRPNLAKLMRSETPTVPRPPQLISRLSPGVAAHAAHVQQQPIGPVFYPLVREIAGSKFLYSFPPGAQSGQREFFVEVLSNPKH